MGFGGSKPENPKPLIQPTINLLPDEEAIARALAMAEERKRSQSRLRINPLSPSQALKVSQEATQPGLKIPFFP